MSIGQALVSNALIAATIRFTAVIGSCTAKVQVHTTLPRNVAGIRSLVVIHTLYAGPTRVEGISTNTESPLAAEVLGLPELVD